MHPPAEIGIKHSFEKELIVLQKSFTILLFLETFSRIISSTDFVKSEKL